MLFSHAHNHMKIFRLNPGPAAISIKRGIQFQSIYSAGVSINLLDIHHFDVKTEF